MVLPHTRIVHLNAKFRFLRKISDHLSQNDIQRGIKTCNLMCTYWQCTMFTFKIVTLQFDVYTEQFFLHLSLSEGGGGVSELKVYIAYLSVTYSSLYLAMKSRQNSAKLFSKLAGVGSQWPFVTLQKIHPCWKEMVSLIPNAGLAVLEFFSSSYFCWFLASKIQVWRICGIGWHMRQD